MKVAQICTNVMSGSVGSIVRNLCKEIESNGDQYLICYGRGKEPVGFNAIKFDNKFDIYSHFVLARLFDSDGLHSKNATKRLIKHLIEFNPDVIHIHCLHGYYINYPILFDYFENSKVKVIWTMHDCWAFTGHCCYYDFNKCNKWKYQCKNCKFKNSYPKSIFVSNSKRNYLIKNKYFNLLNNMVIVTPSKWLNQEIAKSFLKDKKCIVINNGIDITIFHKNSAISKEKIILGVASIWDQRKGLDDFIKLSKILDDDYRIRIIGATKKQIKKLNLHGIEAFERTNSVKELVNEYNKALVLFNPTYEDNYPTVNVEANACGLPVITYMTGGSSEIRELNSINKVVEKGNIEQLIELIKSMPDNDNLEAKRCISKESMVNKYLSVYSEVIG